MSKTRPVSPSPFSSPLHRESSPSTIPLVAYGGITKSTPPKRALKEFGPWDKASTANLRLKQKRRLKPPQTTAEPSFKPGLQLAGCQLQTPAGQDVAMVSQVTLVPTTLAVIKPSWPFCFIINCTPQIGPEIPEPVAQDLYRKYVCSSPLLRPGKLPYMHIGTTNLGFQLNFYLILPNAGGTPHAINTGHLSDEVLQLLFDRCIVPALQTAEPNRSGFTSWMQAMNESNLKTLKSRKKSTNPEIQEERIHGVLLPAIWDSINDCDDEEVKHLLDGKILVAYGCSEQHTWHEGWSSTWASFKKDWEGAIETKYLKEESRVKIEMELELDIPGLDSRTEVEKRRGIEDRKRVRR